MEKIRVDEKENRQKEHRNVTFIRWKGTLFLSK
jgi:hypothetical protein